MKTIKIIDLLSKIANEEEVSKFWWNGCIHEVQEEYGTNKLSIFDTYCKTYKRIELEDLNEEIKFLEEDKKIEEIKINYDEFYKHYNIATTINGEKYNSITNSATDKILCGKINEIIKYMNKENK